MTYPPQQPQYGQPTHGQPPDYPGAGGYGGHSGGPGGEPPTKRNAGMIATVAVVAVLVLAGLALAVFQLVNDDSGNTASNDQTTSAKPGPVAPMGASRPASTDSSAPAGGGDAEIVRVAEAYAEAVKARQETAAKELSCDKTDPGVLYKSTTSGQEVQVTSSRPEMSGSDSAFVDFGVSTSGAEPIDIPILLENSGGWCIAM